MLAFDSYIFDNVTAREVDENGFLHVSLCNITKEQVAPYYGREIPMYEALGFDANSIYYGYRPAEELQKGASSFNNLPLLDAHIKDGAKIKSAKEHRVGSLGDNTMWNNPYLQNSLIVYDQEAIDKINSGEQKELSCAYRYDPIKQEGIWNGQKYDFLMSNIRGNHVALVKEGRAGSDVVVADSQLEKENEMEEVKEIEELDAVAEDSKVKEETSEEKKVDEVIEDKCAKDEDKDESKEDSEKSESKEEKEEDKAEEKDEAEDKAVESKEEDKKEEDKPAMDAMLAEAREQVKAHFMEMANAVEEVKSIVTIKDMFAFDSANDIYKKALEVSGIDTEGCTDYKGMVRVLKVRKPEMSMDSKPADLDGVYSGLKNIRKG